MAKEHTPHTSVHFNGNLLCAIDCETSGLQAGHHDILQLCIMPVAPDLTPSRELDFLVLKLRPKRPDNYDEVVDKVNKGLFVDAMTHGMDAWTGVDRFDEWFKGLKLPVRKQIVPLGANYLFDRDFLIDWLGGPLNYNAYFRSDYRDVIFAANFLNDLADWYSERIPFPKTYLGYLCSQLGIEHLNPHDAVADCMATIEVYRRLMRYRSYADSGLTLRPDPNVKIS